MKAVNTVYTLVIQTEHGGHGRDTVFLQRLRKQSEVIEMAVFSLEVMKIAAVYYHQNTPPCFLKTVIKAPAKVINALRPTEPTIAQGYRDRILATLAKDINCQGQENSHIRLRLKQ